MGAAALVNDARSPISCRLTSTSRPLAHQVPLLFETGPGNPWLVRPWATACGASSRRVVRTRDLQAAAERYRLLDSQAPRDPRTQFRDRRRQLRVSHRSRHAGASLATALGDTGENVVAIVEALRNLRTSHRACLARRPTSTSAAPWGQSTRVFGFWITDRPRSRARGARHGSASPGSSSSRRAPGRWILGLFWMLLALVVTFAAMVGAVWACGRLARSITRGTREPDRLFLMIVGGRCGLRRG